MAGELNIINDEDLEAPLKLGSRYKKLANDFDAVSVSTGKLVNTLETQEATVAQLAVQTKQLEKEAKKLEATNKKAARSAESMAEATNIADNATGGFISKVKALGKQLYTLALNPVVAFLVAIGVALSSVATYFRTTNEGADKLENILAALGAVGSFIQAKFAELGKQIVKLFEEGNVVGELFLGLFNAIVNRVVGAIETFTNLLRVVNTLAKYNLKDIITGNLKPEDIKELKDAFVDMGKSAISAITGVGDAATDAAKKVESTITLLEAQRKLEDAQNERILSSAEAQLKIAKLLFDAKDKANKTDEQRLAFLKQAIALEEQQLKIDIDLATRKERLFTAELLKTRGIIKSNEEVNAVLAKGISVQQERLLAEVAFGEEIGERRKLQADIVNLETGFFNTQKKNLKELAAIQKEIDDAAMERAEALRRVRIKDVEDRIQAGKTISGREILGVKSLIAEEEELRKGFGQRLIDDAKVRAEKEKEIEKMRTEWMKEEEEKRRLIRESALVAVGMIGDEIFNRRQERLSEEAKQVEENRARDLAAAGDDERKKLAINRKADREQAKIKTKQAQADKQAAIFGIIINTALGIMKASPVVPLMIATGILGAIQLALVASKPIPKFAMGTEHTPDTFIAGERGRELVSHNGSTMLAERATIFTGMEGAKVFSNPNTEEILGDISDIGPAIAYGSRVRRERYERDRIVETLAENNKWLKKIAEKPDMDVIVDEEGFHSYSRKMSKRNSRLGRRFLGA